MGWLLVSVCGVSWASTFRTAPLEAVQPVYRVRCGPGRNFSTLLERMEVSRDGKHDEYRFTTEESGEKTVILLQAEDLRPIRVEFYDVNGRLMGSNRYEGDKVILDDSVENRRRVLNLKGDCYDQNTLAYVFRAFPFGAREKVRFKLVSDGRQGQAGLFGMVLKELGEENITVPAGTFSCYKLEMSVDGLAGLFAAKYKYYFWYPKVGPRFLIKYEDSDGRLTELAGFHS